ncbi:prolipoprotein diacylglyceryl transferase [Candidatus Curtissbacteria bacterium RBG_13_40_7]|uniref:Phosphatidylglycerol--prolipoprotein diacylglyceryl transferase n=1 Tax=Candidatus Curtissbacteria bacterium RBG_13_40_7 TaxID=1797706 RepID=A0A1F5FYF4_9BACT|nr:MAG: prolipoprotein diacylglyceryl transferase [Candidatus Curtissbacteria bacterium RBG_13_40_7]
MIPPQISIGPLTFHFYGAIISLSIFLGWLLAQKRAGLYKIPKRLFEDPILIIPLILAIIGARIYHVVDYWDYYKNNLDQVFVIWNGGLGIFGALIGAFLGFWIIAKFKKIDIWKILDLVAPSLLLGQAVGRIANYINQEGFGPPTNKPWGIFISPEHRPVEFLNFSQFHPTFFYEAIIDSIFLIILLFLSKKLKIKGQTFTLYLIFYSIGRFIVEFWRIDTATIGTIKVAQILSVIIFIIGLLVFTKLKARKNI